MRGSSRNRWPLVLLAASTLAACGQVKPVPAPPPRAMEPSRLQTLLEDHCSPCHDGVPDRPSLGIHSTLSDALAFTALLTLSGGKMPPPPTQIRDEVRSELIFELCKSRGEKQPQCLTFFDTSPKRNTIVRRAREFLVDVESFAPTKSRPPTAGPSAKSIIEGAFSRPGTRLDVGLESLRLLLVDEQCPPPVQGSEDSVRAFRACAARILSHELLTVPPFLD